MVEAKCILKKHDLEEWWVELELADIQENVPVPGHGLAVEHLGRGRDKLQPRDLYLQRRREVVESSRDALSLLGLVEQQDCMPMVYKPGDLRPSSRRGEPAPGFHALPEWASSMPRAPLQELEKL